MSSRYGNNRQGDIQFKNSDGKYGGSGNQSKQNNHQSGVQPPSRGNKNPIIIKFYEDDDKTILRADLFDKEARSSKEAFIDNKGNEMTDTQMRRFFNDVKLHKRKLEFSGDKEAEFKKILPHIKMLKSRVAYATSRGHVSFGFRDFINNAVDSIGDYKDYEAFALYFEAIIGFSKKATK